MTAYLRATGERERETDLDLDTFLSFTGLLLTSRESLRLLLRLSPLSLLREREEPRRPRERLRDLRRGGGDTEDKTSPQVQTQVQTGTHAGADGETGACTSTGTGSDTENTDTQPPTQACTYKAQQ